jgi:CHAT domain-containing protein/Tfp pilus assembly protein PilF
MTLLALVGTTAAQQPSAPSRAGEQDLPAPGTATERRIGGQQVDTFRVRLESGHYVRLAARQRGVNVVITALDPDGREFLKVDAFDDPHREEVITFVASVEGDHAISVRPADGSATGGSYLLRSEAVRLATPEDASRIEAERLFVSGITNRLRNQADGWRAAVADFDAALEHFTRLSDRHGQMKVLIEQGRALYSLSRPEAFEIAERGARLARELNEPAALARVMMLEASIVNARGEADAAVEKFEASAAISHELGNASAEANSLMGAALVFSRRGELERAMEVYERALPQARSSGDARLEAGLLNNLGLVYKNLGEYDKAAAAYEQSLANRRAAGDLQGQFPALSNLGNVHGLRGDKAKALELHHAALALARKVGSTRDLSAALDNVATTLERQPDYAAALLSHREALALRRTAGDRIGEASSLAGVGRVLHRLGALDEAEASLTAALEAARRIRQRFGERDALYELASLERTRGDLANAIEHARAAIALDETLRAQITAPELRATFIASEQPLYDLLITLLQQRHTADPAGGYDRQALDVSERARARVLLDSLFEGRIDLRSGVDAALVERERALQRELRDASARLSAALAAGKASASAESAADSVNSLTAEHDNLLAQIRRAHPHYASLVLPEPLSLDEIQQRVLDERTVLLHFSLGQSHSWLWAVTPQQIVSVELPARAEIETVARSLYDALSARHQRAGETDAAYARRVRTADADLNQTRRRLSDMLFRGIAGRLNAEWAGKRLAVVADGALEYVPFGALPIPDPRSGATMMLAARHEVVNIPSASVVDALRRERNPGASAARTLAIVSDPVFELSDPRVDRARAARAAAPPAASQRMAGNRAGLARLPFSREEAAAVASLVPAAQRFQASDFSASRATVLGGALAGHRYVHLATHGVFDADRPALSGLIFSLVNERGQPQDGFLRLTDIYNMRLDADLVVLSACQTALGRQLRGEGLIGLTRGFMYAGAPRVVASLWQVNDAATAELMKKFYRGILTRGLPPAKALHEAQLEMSRESRWQSPYYWAGFVLQGDWQ